MYELEVKVKQLSVRRLLASYWKPDPEGQGCRGCPHYGNVWSCPPGLPATDEYLAPYSGCFLVGARVIYSPETRARAVNQEEADRLREQGYEKVAKELLLTLLELESQVPGGRCMGAGRCILCRRCARLEGKPCRHPELCRYSITGFGFDFARMVKEQLDFELLWNPGGLPEYDVVVAALFYKQTSGADCAGSGPGAEVSRRE